jgi:acyl-coenzyme A synthetase/AMP-(fatty) acid ligase/acyl carrier protein
VPTAFSHFAAALSGAERFPRLRWIVLGSEGLSRRDVDLYRKRFAAGAGLVNRYGTTETGNIAWRFFDAQTDIGSGAVPVGRAMGDAEPLVLDMGGREVASGQVGEIAVRTRFPFGGYWRRPELTAEAFVPDRGARGERVYRTGDVGYRLPGGELVHLGRKDAQAKVRGHRVELGEIERVLLEHPAAGEAVVTVQDRPGGARLVAYITPREGANLAIGALRKFVEARVPGYMVPALFVTLAALPRTPGGKLDRRALPEPEDDARGGEHPKAPRDPVEETLAQIWSEVLGIARIDVDESFFDLGGHSLHAGQIVTRVMDVYRVLVSLRDLFDRPTVAAMAESVRSEMTRAAVG